MQEKVYQRVYMYPASCTLFMHYTVCACVQNLSSFSYLDGAADLVRKQARAEGRDGAGSADRYCG